MSDHIWIPGQGKLTRPAFTIRMDPAVPAQLPRSQHAETVLCRAIVALHGKLKVGSTSS